MAGKIKHSKWKAFLPWALLFLALLLGGCNRSAAAPQAAEPLAAAFLATEAVGEEIRLVAWKELSPLPLDEKELTSQVAAAAASLAPNLEKTSLTHLGHWQEVVYSGHWDDCHYRIIGQAAPTGSHLFAAIQAEGAGLALPELRRQALAALGGEGEINVLLIGTLYEELNQKELEKRFAQALEAAGAEKKQEAREENYYSLSAFVPGLEPQIEADGMGINLQLAAGLGRRGEIKIYAGSPLIFIDY